MRRAILALVLATGCARGITDGLRDGAGGLFDAGPAIDGGPRDAASTMDARALDGALPDAGSLDARAIDARTIDTGTRDTGTDARAGGPDLDPDLDVPPASNPPCTTPGASCPSIAVCRFWSSTEGRCESCSACGNLFDPCSSGEDCDILFVCYQGQCTNFCTLGTFECGPVEDCLDVGHPTRGVCQPG